jgi:hypothetical protein
VPVDHFTGVTNSGHIKNKVPASATVDNKAAPNVFLEWATPLQENISRTWTRKCLFLGLFLSVRMVLRSDVGAKVHASVVGEKLCRNLFGLSVPLHCPRQGLNEWITMVVALMRQLSLSSSALWLLTLLFHGGVVD